MQYDHLLPEVVKPHNHWAPLMDLKAGEIFPMVLVGDFALEDNIFPGTPGDSLLYTSKELDKLRRKGYQVAKHRLPAPPAETSQPPRHSEEGNNSTHKGREPAKAVGSPDKKSSCTQCSPPTKVCQESHNKDCNASKHWEIPKRTRRTASPRASAWDLRCRDPSPREQRRSPIWIIPSDLQRLISVTSSMKWMIYSP